jgi:hypothetical protein
MEEEKIYFEMEVNGEKELLYILKSEMERINKFAKSLPIPRINYCRSIDRPEAGNNVH